MPEISTDLAWYPPEFPAQGRLPSHAALVGKNGKKQASLERQYRDELCTAADKVVPLPCCKILHITRPVHGTRPAGRYPWRSGLLPANLSVRSSMAPAII